MGERRYAQRGSWVQIPAGSTTRVFKQTGETADRVIGGGGGGGGR